MSSIKDWASDAAEHISLEFLLRMGHLKREEATDRIAAIIATFAKPLIDLVEAFRREHYHCDDSWYCCGKCMHSDHFPTHEEDYPSSHDGRVSGKCDCGADAWNARVDAAMAGQERPAAGGGTGPKP